MTLPRTTGSCWCGCGGLTDGHFLPGHDRRAVASLLKLLHGPLDTAACFLRAHGYGPDGKNLREEVGSIEKEVRNVWALSGKRASR